MLIGIDLDDILANFISPLLKFYNQKHRTALCKKDITSYRYNEVWGGTRENAIKEVYDFYRSPSFETVAPKKGAVVGINCLTSFELIVITSRPALIKKQTIDWINKYYPNRFDQIYFSNHFVATQKIGETKGEICNRLGVNVLVDDSLEYALECQESNTKVLLLDSPWNQSSQLPHYIKRVFSWKDIVRQFIKSPRV